MTSNEARGTRWPLVRLALGIGQMFGALMAGWLLLTGGVTPAALVVVVLTCGLTTASVLLFGRGSPNPPEHRS